MDLRVHLTRSLDEGGHGLEGYPIEVLDHRDVHEEDHLPGAWWQDAITHNHPPAGNG